MILLYTKNFSNTLIFENTLRRVVRILKQYFLTVKKWEIGWIKVKGKFKKRHSDHGQTNLPTIRLDCS